MWAHALLLLLTGAGSAILVIALIAGLKGRCRR
jgi:hypothetical protein